MARGIVKKGADRRSTNLSYDGKREGEREVWLLDLTDVEFQPILYYSYVASFLLIYDI